MSAEKLQLAIAQLVEADAHPWVHGHVADADKFRALAALAGATIESSWAPSAVNRGELMIVERFEVVLDGARISVSHARQPTIKDWNDKLQGARP